MQLNTDLTLSILQVQNLSHFQAEFENPHDTVSRESPETLFTPLAIGPDTTYLRFLLFQLILEMLALLLPLRTRIRGLLWLASPSLAILIGAMARP